MENTVLTFVSVFIVHSPFKYHSREIQRYGQRPELNRQVPFVNLASRVRAKHRKSSNIYELRHRYETKIQPESLVHQLLNACA